MNLTAFRALLTPLGQQALAQAVALQPTEESYLRHYQNLSRRYDAQLAQAALETAILRRKAQAKTPFAKQLYFTQEALEQASHWEIARYRAQRMRGAAFILDLGCSIGSDSFAFAEVALTVGIDRDALRLAMAQANRRALNLEERIGWVRADLTQPLPFGAPLEHAAAFFDPARRVGGQRRFHVDRYQPPLGVLCEWQKRLPNLAVKLSPAVDLQELAPYGGEIEFISFKGELKEAVLWLGGFVRCARRATLLPAGVSLESETPVSDDQLPLASPAAYLYEPDPAILRAGLVRKLGQMLNAWQMDDEIAYLTAEQSVSTPFARCWQVESWFPFQLKRLRAYLQERHVGKVIIKKRGSPLQPEALQHALRLKGEEERVLFLTHLRGKPIVIIAFPQ
ncbi:MAG: SAM-dependent methyltransferase [Anaerolineae bacterium]|jgi:SAM-dependent methyltransferase|nr:MAG: SAM-dependent methyltransferase [Anaerolineae bacterium]